ncbi:LysR family transcriptional regulator [Blautia obeum]|uniref:LysR family transcriptional regulator n=1 Tax=Blautia obeum TaxID=40520 RepID=UPI003562A28F
MDINLELYKVFYYVATTLSFSEASRQLFISQSAVSQSVKTLEKKLGHTLFIRSTKKVFLTPEGELLLRHVKPAIQMLDEGESLLSGDTLKGQLRIGASDTICRYFLIEYFRKFHQAYPDVRVKVTNSTSIGCVELLEKGQVDLIVCNSPNSRLGSHTRVQVLKDFHDIFVADPNCFAFRHLPCSFSDLMQYPILMLSSKSTTSEYLYHTFALHDLKLLPEVELNSNDLLMDLARIGLGIACIPDYMLSSADSLKPIPMTEVLPSRQLIMVQNDNLPVSQAAERFLELF